MVLFFRLGIEQRLRQIGILRATGYTSAICAGCCSAEAAALALAGGVLGIAGAVGYAQLVVYGLKTWWVGAVGTTLLSCSHAGSLAVGSPAGMAASLICVRAVAAGGVAADPAGAARRALARAAAASDPQRARRSARCARRSPSPAWR